MRRIAAVAALAATLALPGLGTAAPARTTAYYMYATTLSGLQSEAYNKGYAFAQHHPGGDRVLLLDFGAARRISDGVYGTQIFSSSPVYFDNSQILAALKSGANGVHNGYVGGTTQVAYGNNNSYMTSHGMTWTDAHNVGYYQEYRAAQLASYQSANGYNMQSAVAASDMEPGFDGPGITRSLVNGANTYADRRLYYNYGSADGCPQSGSGGSCNNGWTVGDVAWVSYSGSAVPLPEIYYGANAYQWTVIRRNGQSQFGSFYFWGTTGSTGVGLTPAEGWNSLNSLNSGLVFGDLVCFGC